MIGAGSLLVLPRLAYLAILERIAIDSARAHLAASRALRRARRAL